MYERICCPVTKQQAGNSCNALENALRPAVIMSPQAEAPPDFKSAPF